MAIASERARSGAPNRGKSLNRYPPAPITTALLCCPNGVRRSSDAPTATAISSGSIAIPVRAARPAATGLMIAAVETLSMKGVMLTVSNSTRPTTVSGLVTGR